MGREYTSFFMSRQRTAFSNIRVKIRLLSDLLALVVDVSPFFHHEDGA